MIVRKGREIFFFDASEVGGEVGGCFGEDVVCGDEEEERRRDEAGKEHAVASEDGPGEGGYADVEEPGGEGFIGRDDGFDPVYG